jgi:ABC-2 type transport system permease protein
MMAIVGRIAARNLLNIVRIPGNVITVVGLPVLTLVVFSGAFARITTIAGFPTTQPIAWVTPYAVALGAIFAGLGSAFNVQRDIANGFMDRLLLTPASRASLILGEVAGSIGRALIQLAAVLAVAIPAGLRMPAGPVALIPLVLLAVGVATWSGLCGLALMYWMKSAHALGLVTGLLLAVGLMSTGLAPLKYQLGWLRAVARANPLTPVLAAGRQGFLGALSWGQAGPGLLALVAVAALLGLLAAHGIRRFGVAEGAWRRLVIPRVLRGCRAAARGRRRRRGLSGIWCDRLSVLRPSNGTGESEQFERVVVGRAGFGLEDAEPKSIVEA